MTLHKNIFFYNPFLPIQRQWVYYNANPIFNVQMAHGGTNFGFYNGANTIADESGYTYKPDITSYDYVRIFLTFSLGEHHSWYKMYTPN